MATTKELTLPISGQVVMISDRRMKVRDNDQAFRMVGGEGAKSPICLMAARIAIVTTKADGSSIPYEDILDWDEDDLNAVISKREDPAFFQTPAVQS